MQYLNTREIEPSTSRNLPQKGRAQIESGPHQNPNNEPLALPDRLIPYSFPSSSCSLFSTPFSDLRSFRSM